MRVNRQCIDIKTEIPADLAAADWAEKAKKTVQAWLDSKGYPGHADTYGRDPAKAGVVFVLFEKGFDAAPVKDEIRKTGRIETADPQFATVYVKGVSQVEVKPQPVARMSGLRR